jgi:hypothetical protein
LLAVGQHVGGRIAATGRAGPPSRWPSSCTPEPSRHARGIADDGDFRHPRCGESRWGRHAMWYDAREQLGDPTHSPELIGQTGVRLGRHARHAPDTGTAGDAASWEYERLRRGTAATYLLGLRSRMSMPLVRLVSAAPLSRELSPSTSRASHSGPPAVFHFRSSTQAAPCPPSRSCANSTINTSWRRVRCSHTRSRRTPAPLGEWVPLP